jgi:2,5-diketo-D-gluconate reductase A
VTKTVNFANGGEIPVIGFGTWQIKGQTCVDAVRTALRSDYRHVDTATMYGNEAEVGVAGQRPAARRRLPHHQAAAPAGRQGAPHAGAEPAQPRHRPR